MKLRIGNSEVSLQRPVVMTIINVTPDSFYAKSRTRFPDEIVGRAEQAISDGAAILDIGGYSSRPGADDVSAEEEFRRVAAALCFRNPTNGIPYAGRENFEMKRQT